MPLTPLVLGKITLPNNDPWPPLVRPLQEAAERGSDLGPALDALTKHFGFDSIMYGVSASPTVQSETQQWVFTNLPLAWVYEYDQNSYVEVDPRIQIALESWMPFFWDQSRVRGRSPRCDQFLDAQQRAGTGSGFVVPLRDPRSRFAILSLNSRSEVIAPDRLSKLNDFFGEAMMVAMYLHNLVVTKITEDAESTTPPASPLIPLSKGGPLSKRELQCLALSVKGNKSKAIADVLGLKLGTVQLHFDSIRSKLGARNRDEAVAKAIKMKLIPE